MSFKEKRNRHLIRQRTKSKEDKRVKFPQDIVFNEMVKDGDSSEIINFLRRESVDVDVNQRNEHGMTALKDLIMKDNLKCVKVLVNQGADVNGKDANGSYANNSFLRCQCFLFNSKSLWMRHLQYTS